MPTFSFTYSLSFSLLWFLCFDFWPRKIIVFFGESYFRLLFFFGFVEFIVVVHLNCFIALLTFELWQLPNDRNPSRSNQYINVLHTHKSCREWKIVENYTKRMPIIWKIWHESSGSLAIFIDEEEDEEKQHINKIELWI